ncbi:hypothetical protein EDC94DRAFT_494598, partial [Helicostylum pulchrum]
SYPKNYGFLFIMMQLQTQEKHLTAFYKLAEICESYGFKSFQCFPLRNTFIPSYITIDTMILNNQILK